LIPLLNSNQYKSFTNKLHNVKLELNISLNMQLFCSIGYKKTTKQK